MMASGVGNEIDGDSQDIIDNLKKQIEELKKQNEELKKGQATGDATEDQVLSGATFSTSKGVNLTGTMPSYTSGSQEVTESGKWGIDTKYGAWSYIPRSGYYSTSYWLNIPWATIKGSLGNATTANVLNGATFTSENGVKLTGTMPSYTSGSQAVTTSGKWGFSTQYGAWEYIPNNGYYSTGHWLNIPWATIKGSLGTATTGNVLSGTTFTSTNGIKLTGTMANRGAVSATINPGGSYTIPAGYHNGSGKVTANSVISAISSASVVTSYVVDKNENANTVKYSATVSPGIYVIYAYQDWSYNQTNCYLQVSGGSNLYTWHSTTSTTQKLIDVYVQKITSSTTLTLKTGTKVGSYHRLKYAVLRLN